VNSTPDFKIKGQVDIIPRLDSWKFQEQGSALHELIIAQVFFNKGNPRRQHTSEDSTLPVICCKTIQRHTPKLFQGIRLKSAETNPMEN
jgi:hypothetical protein